MSNPQLLISGRGLVSFPDPPPAVLKGGLGPRLGGDLINEATN